jgi:hypothetical protein
MEETLKSIQVGFQVFLKDGGDEVGAVRDIRHKTHEILINIENAGDFIIHANSVRAVHSQKVILDGTKLPNDVKAALRHAHDAEEPGL